MRILVSGATGLVGSRLVRWLTDRGDEVRVVSRGVPPAGTFPAGVVVRTGDIRQTATWSDALQGVEAVVHLAGENIFARRWTKSFMQTLWDSRIDTTKAMAAAVAEVGGVRTVLSASAIGYYGNRGDEDLTETSPAGVGFMADLSKAWEAAAEPVRTAGVRLVHPRIGIVLDPLGGALPNLVRPFRWFVGGRVGSGRQYLSWIHHHDLTRLLGFLVDTAEVAGPVNATAPEPVTNRETCAALARVLRRPNWLPAPAFGVRLLLGRVAEVVTGGQRVRPTAALRHGFTFTQPAFEPAVRDVLGRKLLDGPAG